MAVTSTAMTIARCARASYYNCFRSTAYALEQTFARASAVPKTAANVFPLVDDG